MQVSAEIRWFWSGTVPRNVDNWFRDRRFTPGGGKPREDVYLHDPAQGELGIKKRGSKAGVEVKGLAGHFTLGDLPSWPHVRPEIWCKWSSAPLDISAYSTVSTNKIRWLRKFDTSSGAAREIQLGEDEMPLGGIVLPEQGCNVEFTQIRIANSKDEWWTLGFEAFGELDTVQDNLRSTLKGMTSPDQDCFHSSEVLSYPAWLSKISV